MGRKKKLSAVAVSFLLSVLLAACGNAAIEETTPGLPAETGGLSEEAAETGLFTASETEEETAGTKSESAGGTGPVENRVEIRAVVKELAPEKMLISSKSDLFPGAFYVEIPETGVDLSGISEGDTVLIRMKKLEKTEQNLPCYEAIWVTQSLQQQEGREDILLTGAPEIRLQDALSGTFSEYVLQPGIYSWNYMQDGEMQGIVACGEITLETADTAENKLKIPDYNGLETVFYSFGCRVLPDQITVQEWELPVSGTEQQPVSETYCYEKPVLIELKKDRAYIITAVWSAQEGTENGFYGEAQYVLVTE